MDVAEGWPLRAEDMQEKYIERKDLVGGSNAKREPLSERMPCFKLTRRHGKRQKGRGGGGEW